MPNEPAQSFLDKIEKYLEASEWFWKEIGLDADQIEEEKRIKRELIMKSYKETKR